MKYLIKQKNPMIPKSNKIIAAIASSILIVSCGAPTVVSTPIQNIDAISLKNIDLTDSQLKSWGSLDLVSDTIPGMSINKTYTDIIKNRKGQTIIVGVIDSGVDIEHEDLNGVIWTNPKEIKGNGKDDDNNGYIDDIHGWNFLGDSENENLEFVRVVKKLKPKYAGKNLASVAKTDQEEYQLYIEAKAEYEKKYQEASGQKMQYEQILQQSEVSHQSVAEVIGKENYSRKELLNIEAKTPEMQQHVAFLAQMFGFMDPEDTIPDFIKNIKEGVEHFTEQLNYNLNIEFDGRQVVGDNVDDITDTKYGNNNVMGPDPKKKGIKHGTHVAGIIAAERNNGKGMNGVAQNVKIMAIRAVPNGDEYDKDIALALRYAVDNGAKVINTSFGKYYSTHPDWVRDAIIYAESKDVLIVNAAGNESTDLDQKAVYPNDQPNNGNEIANNFITIGALNYTYGSNLVADFSNYGKNNVDAFAPGVKIWATTPNNSYEYLQGTSMAAPGVAGVAALIRSYYPKLKAAQVKQILMDSGLGTKTSVVIGGEQTNVGSFSELSKSGKIVNLYNAFIMADKLSK
ncbi:S8 family peptidase [Aquimarina muelleri]|uniref:Peptidase S8 n=1 Tax=Aquimarina muelleri TaxID=279356 RepID=A0A918JVA0_9FLAO|nr:S8 family peptidase [Aquimarina muelleri]MCX2763194.1 S8 family peptidase [Aquimarina muelleri]GGX19867.1 peptidase S8 [Aquimarina muelleri]